FFLVQQTEVNATHGNQPVVYAQGSDIIYNGYLSSAGYQLLLDTSANSGTKPARLVINSGGGPVDAGMDIGIWVFEKELDVLVIEKCMSSCANYVFPAAKNKEISEGAVVAWHGSAVEISQAAYEDFITDMLKNAEKHLAAFPAKEREIQKEQLVSNFKKWLNNQQIRQKGFFKIIGIDERVTVLGEEYGVVDFYFLSVEDMHKFGIKNIKAPINYAATDLTPFRKKKPIEFLKLKER
ncbi:MAG: hypothetical protein U1C55_00735, partial [Smithellaceae bacterium]|nr:hypothetical protein [Smithellaceae bacterium]